MAELDPQVAVRRWPLVVAVLAIGAVLFYLLQPILMPFVVGALIAYLGDPAVDLLEERKINRTLGVSIVFLAFTALVVIAMLIAVPNVIQQLDSLIGKIPDLYQWVVDSAVPWLQSRLNIPMAAPPAIDWSGQLAQNWQSLSKFGAEALKQISGSGASLLLGLTNLALVPVVAFYLMRDWDILREKALCMLPKVWQSPIANMMAESDDVVGAFLRGQFMVMCALGAIYSIGLGIVGLQLALVLGLIAGLASIVPYLGFVVGISISLVAAYAQFQDWVPLLWVLLVFGIGQMLESMVLTPLLVGDRIGLHPVAVIFALMAGGQLAGFVGVVLALPVAAVVMVFIRHAVQRYRASELYGGKS